MAPTTIDSPTAEHHGVVVGVDGSPTALTAVRWGAVEARLRALPLNVLHAAPYTADNSRPALRRAHDILARALTVARRTEPELRVTTTRTDESPAHSLLSAAEQAQLLVLGMSGGERLLEALFRSIALDICGRASCPVAVIRGESTRKDGDVVVGVQAPDADAAALDLAFADARRHGGGVLVLHALHGAGEFRDRITAHEQRAHDAALVRLSDELTPWSSRYSDVPVRIEVVHGQPAGALLTASIPARLVVMGAHSRGAAARALFGSTGREVTRCCPVPVIVVNPRSARRSALLASMSTANEEDEHPHFRGGPG